MTAIDDNYTPNYHVYDKPTTINYFVFTNHIDSFIDCGQTQASPLSVAYMFGLPLDLDYPQAASVEVERELLLQSLRRNCRSSVYCSVRDKIESSAGKRFFHYSYICRYEAVHKTVIGYAI